MVRLEKETIDIDSAWVGGVEENDFAPSVAAAAKTGVQSATQRLRRLPVSVSAVGAFFGVSH